MPIQKMKPRHRAVVIAARTPVASSVLGREPLHGQDRPEDLLTDDAHVAPDVGQHGRAVEEAGLELRLGRA
jgi:hypothetical protein